MTVDGQLVTVPEPFAQAAISSSLDGPPVAIIATLTIRMPHMLQVSVRVGIQPSLVGVLCESSKFQLRDAWSSRS